MPFNLNRVELIGRLGRDPELRYTAEGHAVAKFSLATDRPVKADSPAETDWHQIICWRELAEFAGEYLTKGRPVFVAGRLTYRTWEGKDGQQRHATEIVANQLILLDRRPEAAPRDLGGAVEGDDLPSSRQSPIRWQPVARQLLCRFPLPPCHALAPAFSRELILVASPTAPRLRRLIVYRRRTEPMARPPVPPPAA
jgi:single-strand DNA-binding protein